MIQINTENLQKISAEHGLTQGEIEKESSLIPSYLEKIHSREQGFYKVIDDKSLLEKINSYATNVRNKYDYIVVLGIGGSALGTICIQQSLSHLFEHEFRRVGKPILHILDNIDPALLREAQEVIDISRTLFIVVTKSGSTPETLAQYMYFRDECNKAGLEASKHFLFITDPEKGLLRKIANQEGILSFEVPPNVGGRFSVLTAVGLVPAKLIGIKIENLIEGAKSMRDKFLSENPEENMPFLIATIQYLLFKKGKKINTMIPYAQKLIRFTDWYLQLLAESIGKRLNNDGNEIFNGITPVNALGATDQHSQTQLYNEGPNDKLHILIKVNNLGKELKIPYLYPEEEEIGFLRDVSFNKLFHTEMEGTIQSLTENDRPIITLEIDEINEFTLGELFMLFEGATAFLGEFFNINAFDQPGVELGKVLTKKMLS
jgi:glucose-6-phosphate isomerase